MMETNNEGDYSCLLYHQRLKYGGRVQRGLKEIFWKHAAVNVLRIIA